MTRARLTPLLLCLAALTCLTGCDYNTFRITYEMEANNTASVHVTGRQPSLQITNLGPGEVSVQFFADKYPMGDARPLKTGETTAEAMGGPFSAEMRTAEVETEVKVEATTAGKLTVDPATPD
ncbi:MAG: hypothetical protein ACF8NJ_04000 [Phycisphaerales bacterium JB038]